MLPSLCSQTHCFCVLHLSECLCYPSSSPCQNSGFMCLSPVLQLPRQSVLQQVLLSPFPTLLSSCHLSALPGLPRKCFELVWLISHQAFFHIPIRKITLRSMNRARYRSHPAFGMLKQRNCIKFEANLTYRVKFPLKKKTTKFNQVDFLLKSSAVDLDNCCSLNPAT